MVSPATTLDDASTKALLARLEPLPDLSGSAAPPLPPSTPPPPSPGTVEPIAFVAPTGKQVSDAPIVSIAAVKPLVAPQITPRGDITAEREIRIRFDEPMIAVAAVNTEAHPNVTITPTVAGTWRWLDTHVLTFTTAAARFPMATEFTVTVPAGVRAVSGATLAADTREAFSTAPPSISSLYPHVELRPDSPLAIVFDQQIDPDQIVAKLAITGPDKRRVAVKPISLDEARALWSKHPMLTAFDPAKDLGRSAIIVVPASGTWRPGGHVATLAKGAPSREGPRVSTQPSYLEMIVAKPFSLTGLQCGDITTPRLASVRCPANDSVRMTLTNPLASTVHPDQIQIENQPPRDLIGIGQSEEVWMKLPEEPPGRTFTIVFGSDLVDVYGQAYVGVKRASFTTGPEVFAPELDALAGLYVLDPRFTIPQWSVRAESVESVHVELYRVTPDDYFAFRNYERHRRTTLPGKQIHAQTVAVGKSKGATARIDLRPALGSDGVGHVIAIATSKPLSGGTPETRVAWIEVTKLGVTARVDSDNVHAWVHDISPTKLVEPRKDVETSFVVEGLGTTNTATTDAAGHASFALVDPKKVAHDAESLMIVTSGSDVAFAAMGGPKWREQRTRDQRWYVTDDRFMYKPGETAYVKGWLRWSDNRINPDIAIPDRATGIDYSLVDARGNKLAHGTLELSDTGGFDVALALPANAALGYATLELATKSGAYRHNLAIQEFRRPAFAVSLDDDVGFAASQPVIAGESIDMSVSASYYAGGGLAGGGVTWEAKLEAGSYQPPGWDLFTFEPRHPRSAHARFDADAVRVNQATTLSASSVSRTTIEIAATASHAPGVLTVDSNVTDVDRMTIRASSHPVVVHPSAYYVGLREQPNAMNQLLVVVTDIAGRPVANVPVDVEITGVMGSEMSHDDAKVMDTQHCTLTSAATPSTCTFTRTNDAYAYTAVAQVRDARQRLNTAQYAIPWWQPSDAKADLWIVPDRKHYKPGDVAKLDIHSTVLPATAIVSFTRQGVIAQKRLAMTSEVTKVELPIDEAFRENVTVLVDRTGPRRRLIVPTSPPLPEITQSAIDLAVDVDSARLATTARALDPLVEPGANATFEVDVRRDNAPVANAEVALMVVDEAVLALSGQHHKNPIESFYRHVQHGTQSVSTIPLVNDAGYLLSEQPGVDHYDLDGGTGWGTIGSGRYGSVGHGSGGAGMSGTVLSRKDFRANAAFSPMLHTDATGKVRLTVKMPDSLTRFRVVALAASGAHYFGLAEGTIVTQLKINARTVAPRFANQGDAFSVPVVVQNLDRKPRTIDVAMRAANLVAAGPQGKRVTIPGGQRAEVRFDFQTRSRGPAVVQTIAVSGDFADASNTTFPVYEPATTESFATYGTVDAGSKFERVVVPKDVFPEVGGVEVTVSSTQLQALTDAYWYLYNYPYECAEQRSARMLATQAVWDILEAFDTPGRPTKSEIGHIASNDLTILARDQRPDGGWGYFSGMTSDPYVTMQVTRALAGNKPATDVMIKATKFVTGQATALMASLDVTLAAKPGDRKLDRDHMTRAASLAATALSTLAATGIDVRARAVHLHQVATQLGQYPVDAKARVLSLVASWPAAAGVRAKLVGDLLSATHETAASATVATSYTDGEMVTLPSSTKTTALVLDALIREVPSHALITKLAHGLLDSRHGGRWSSTQDNLVVLSALRRYFDTYEKQTPNFTGKLWFGTQAYAEQGFVGRSTKRAQARVGWTTLTPGANDIAIVKDGTGRMYYRVGIDYAPKRVDLPALDAGFVVRRSYAAVDRPDDVTKDKTGRWHVKLGARVVVTVETLASTVRHAVAVVDPMPAGFEAVNENLATAERAVLTHDDNWDFRDMRDTRVEAFGMQLPEGSHRMSYTARATTPGTFVAAPAKAEEMYSPETFGRSTGETVVIEN